jgi:hypothetical protein
MSFTNKSKLEVSLLALSLVSVTPSWATKVTGVEWPDIDTTKTLNTISKQSIKIVKQKQGVGALNPPILETSPITSLTSAASSHITTVRTATANHNHFLYADKRATHLNNHFTSALRPAMKNLIGNGDEALLTNVAAQVFLANLFNSFQNDLRSESAEIDHPALKQKIKSGYNKFGKAATIIPTASLAIPLYGEDRATGTDYLTPAGKTLTSQQKAVTSFIDQLLRTLPDSFKRGVQLSLTHPDWSTEQLLTNMTTGNIPKVILPPVVKTAIGETVAAFVKKCVERNNWKAYESDIVELGYIVGERLHELMNRKLVFKSYKESLSYDQYLLALKSSFSQHLHKSGLLTKGNFKALEDKEQFFTNKLLKDWANYGAVMFGASLIPVESTDHQRVRLALNNRGHLALYSPLTKSHYAFFTDQQDKDSYWWDTGNHPFSPLAKSLALYMLNEQNKDKSSGLIIANGIKGKAPLQNHLDAIAHLSHVAYNVFQDYVEALTKPDHLSTLKTHDQLIDFMEKAFIHHLGLVGLTDWSGGTYAYITKMMADRLTNQVLGLSGSSVTLLLKDAPELTLGTNGKGDSSILSATTGLSYPVLKDKRIHEDAFFPKGFLNDKTKKAKTQVASYLTANKIIEKNSFFEQSESLTSLGNVVDSLSKDAPNYTREEFKERLTQALVKHVELTGTKDLILNSQLKFKEYVKDLLSDRLFNGSLTFYGLERVFKNDKQPMHNVEIQAERPVANISIQAVQQVSNVGVQIDQPNEADKLRLRILNVLAGAVSDETIARIKAL